MVKFDLNSTSDVRDLFKKIVLYVFLFKKSALYTGDNKFFDVQILQQSL